MQCMLIKNMELDAEINAGSAWISDCDAEINAGSAVI